MYPWNQLKFERSALIEWEKKQEIIINLAFAILTFQNKLKEIV